MPFTNHSQKDVDQNGFNFTDALASVFLLEMRGKRTMEGNTTTL